MREYSPIRSYPYTQYAGLPVRTYKAALTWYEQLLGCPPTFLVSDIEAVWELAEYRLVFIEKMPKRAGNALHTRLSVPYTCDECSCCITRWSHTNTFQYLQGCGNLASQPIDLGGAVIYTAVTSRLRVRPELRRHKTRMVPRGSFGFLFWGMAAGRGLRATGCGPIAPRYSSASLGPCAVTGSP